MLSYFVRFGMILVALAICFVTINYLIRVSSFLRGGSSTAPATVAVAEQGSAPAVEPSISIPESAAPAAPALPAAPASPAAATVSTPATPAAPTVSTPAAPATPAVTLDAAAEPKPVTFISEISPHDPEAFMDDEEEEATPSDANAKKTN